MKATLLLALTFDWSGEVQYAASLNETLERMRQVAFVDVAGERQRGSDKVSLSVLATFDYETEYDYASKLVEVVDYAREYASATIVAATRGEGIAAEGHLMEKAAEFLNAGGRISLV